MKKILALQLTGAAMVALIPLAATGISNADATTVASNTIPKSVLKTERLDAAASVLNTSTANIQAAHKNKTFKQLVTNDGLTPKTYREALKAKITSDLEVKGYSQAEVTTALKHAHRQAIKSGHKKA